MASLLGGVRYSVDPAVNDDGALFDPMPRNEVGSSNGRHNYISSSNLLWSQKFDIKETISVSS